jgi:hypothetical protein
MSELESTIRALRPTAEGEVCSRSRVIDALLDLRLEAVGRSEIVELIDAALASAPGKTMVPAAWWREQLDTFELVAINPVEPVG